MAANLLLVSLARKTRTNYSSSRWFNLSLVRHASSSTVVADRLNNKTTPWLMLPSEVDPSTGEKLDCFYSLADSHTVKLNRNKSLKVPDTARCMASTKGSWLGFADTKDGSLYLSNPFSNDVVELPSLGTLPRVVGVERDSTGSVLHFKVMFPDYDRDLWDDPEFDGLPELVEPETMAKHHMFHLALSHKDPRDYDCVAMAVQGEISRLAYCKTDPHNNNNNDAVWYGLQEDYPMGDLKNQIVYSSKTGLFYSLCCLGIQAFDLHRDRGRRTKDVGLFCRERLEKQRKEGLPTWLKNMECNCLVEYYLVTLPSNGDLWLIVRYLDIRREYDYSMPTLHFDVFRVAYPGRLERVTYLEDRAIFIGSNQSFCIDEASGSPGIRPNCIYFTDDVVHFSTMLEWGHDTGIFNMESGVITQFYPYKDEKEEKKVPFTIPLFWVAPLSMD